MKTKYFILIVIASLMATSLAGCGNASITASSSGELSTASRYALGILKLEGTSNAVTSSQANDLLTLWEGYQSLSASDTASQVELDALVTQIHEALTAEQVKAIDAMGLTETTLSATLSTLGGTAPTNQSSSTLSAPALSSLGASGGSNTMPSGGPGGAPPDGSDGGPAGGDSSGVNDILNTTSSQGTAVATRAATAASTAQVNPILLRAVIQLLETRSQSAG
jgi:hypothetical protein